MNKKELLKLLEGLDDDTEIKIVDSGTSWPCKGQYVPSSVGFSCILLVRDESIAKWKV